MAGAAAWKGASLATVVMVGLAPAGAWLILFVGVLFGEWRRVRVAVARLAANQGDWLDLSMLLDWRLLVWSLLHPNTSLQTRIGPIDAATRPLASGGTEHPRDPHPLFRWVQGGGSVDTLALCVAAGVSDGELLAHLDGTGPLDLDQVALMAALRGPARA